VFPYGEGGRMNYVANARRGDVVRAMYEFIEATKEKWGEDIAEDVAGEDEELGRLRQRVAELEGIIRRGTK
jgi:methylphosphotriester-DNA--protein-cysteine methyltransferase